VAAATRVYVERGTKRVFACVVDWPGWCRSGKDEQQALEALAAYRPRYARVAKLARLELPASTWERFEVVEQRQGSAGTDFGVPSAIGDDDVALSPAQRSRLADLVEASWTLFDRVVAKAPAELRKGPRGGGRDRDKVAAHVYMADYGYARQLGLSVREPREGDATARAELREAVLSYLRGTDKPTNNVKRPWPRRYGARRIAWHALDHAWEIEDRSEPAPE
jgi:hypothetical protein